MTRARGSDTSAICAARSGHGLTPRLSPHEATGSMANTNADTTSDRDELAFEARDRAVRVLVVEDEPFIALDLERRLTARGFLVVAIADNGPEAIDIVLHEQPDIVLMDVHIIGPLDGIEAARKIADLSDVPVVFLTAYSDEETVSRSTAASPYGYVSKPLDEHTLLITMRIALARHASERRAHLLRAAVASATVGVALVDVRGAAPRVIYANDQLVAMSRVPRGTLVGGPVWLPKPATGDTFIQQFEEALARRERADGIAMSRSENGTSVWTSITMSPVKLPTGLVEHIAIFYRDMTAQREAERRLASAERMEIIGRMAAGVAHDFNNLLGVITGFAEFAREADDLADVRGDVDEILLAAQRGASFTRKLLDYTRGPEASPAGGACDVVRAVREMFPMLLRLCGERVRVVFDSRFEGGAAVPIDATAAERIVMNLVSNARDAMPEGGTVRVVVAPEAPSAELPHIARVRITVADEGVGMDEQTLAHAFDPLFTTKPLGQGTGLGLPNVRALVERAGGTVTIESAPNKGTEVSIFFAAQSTPEADRTRGSATT